MIGFITDGEVPQTSEDIANQEYLSAPPSESELFGAKVSQESTIGTVSRAAERGLTRAFAPGNLLPADEINNRYAPLGPDGKQVKIASEPMYENVGELLGKQKGEEINRQGIIARGEQVHDGIDNFTSSMAAFLVDPINTASMFVPGVGEEMAANAVGRVGLTGYGATLGSRLIQGSTAGAAGTAVLSGVKYGLDPDYQLRDAFNDMAYGAAGGAIIHAGLGAVGDIWKAARGTASPMIQGEPHTEATKVLDADGPTKKAAMDASVAQMIDGREVNVDPYFPPEYKENMTIADMAEEQKRIYENGFASGMTPDELANATEELFPREETPGEGVSTEEPTTFAQTPTPPLEFTTPPEKVPDSLLQFISKRGGLKDETGELTAMGVNEWHKERPFRSKLVKEEGVHPDDVAMAAWEKGYFPELRERPDVNTLYDKIEEELKGRKQYPSSFLEHANEDPEYMRQLSEHLSIAQRDKLGVELAEHHEAQLEEVNKLEKEFTESRGEAWEPEQTQTATLEDLENEWKQEVSARKSQTGASNIEQSGGTSGTQGFGQETANNIRGASELPGRTGEKPGTNAGRGGSSKPSELDNQIAQLQSKLDLNNITDEERADLEAANKEVVEADAYRKGYEAAANCLAGIV